MRVLHSRWSAAVDVQTFRARALFGTDGASGSANTASTRLAFNYRSVLRRETARSEVR